MTLTKRTRFIMLLVLIAATMIYFPINRAVSGGRTLRIFIDDYIPLWAIWAVPYILSLFWWVGCVLWAWRDMDDETYAAFIGAWVLACLVSAVIYIIYPVYVTRPPISGGDWANRLIALIYSQDRAYNAFPSGHTFNSVLIYLFFSRWRPRLRVPFGIFTIIVLLSTLFTRQHWVTDVAGGIALAVGCYYLALWVMRRVKCEA